MAGEEFTIKPMGAGNGTGQPGGGSERVSPNSKIEQLLQETPNPGRAAGFAGRETAALDRLRAGRVNQEPEAPTAAEYDKMSWGEYLPIVAQNAPSSAWNVVKGLGNAVLHPIDTGTAVYQLGTGLGSKAIDAASVGITGEPVFDPTTKGEREAVADALIGSYKGRYGGGEEGEFWKHLAEDPMGYAADAATVLTGGAGAASKAGLINKAGTAAKVAEAAAYLDPAAAAMKLAKLPVGESIKAVGRTVPYIPMLTSGLGTGLPLEVLKSARQIGLSGDPDRAIAFVEALQKNPNFTSDLHLRFKAAIEEMRDRGTAEYLRNLRTSSMNNAPVDLTGPTLVRNEIEQLIDPSARTNSPRDPRIAPPYDAEDIKKAQLALSYLDDARTSPRVAAGTIASLDSVKKDIRTLSDQIKNPYLSARVRGMAAELSRAMGETDPAYARAMGAYEGMLDKLNQTTKDFGSSGLSDAQRANKLASQYKRGNADEVFSRLEGTESGKNLRDAITGAAASPWLSQKVQNAIATSGGLGAIGYGLSSHPAALISAAAAAAMSSPRLAANLQYNLGRAERNVNKFAGRLYDAASQPVVTNVTSQIGSAMAPESETTAQAYGGRVGRKAGGRVGVDHERIADQLVTAAERAKKGISRGTEQLLDLPDDHIAHALEVANRSI